MKMESGDYPSLHDATLENIDVSWREGTISFRVRLVRMAASDPSEALLTARSVLEFKVDRLLPWGPSESIYSAELAPHPDQSISLKLQMQSGDLIHVRAQSFELNESAKRQA